MDVLLKNTVCAIVFIAMAFPCAAKTGLSDALEDTVDTMKHVFADTSDINVRTMRESNMLSRISEDIYSLSPSSVLYRKTYSFSQAGLSYKVRREDKPVLYQLGDGEDIFGFSASSYLRLDGKSVAYADVRYGNGVIRNVLWNSSSDFLLLYPYVMADTVGGNLRTEEYCFSGGYSGRKGKLIFGGSMSYRALHEFRKIDPRPRNITSDFSATASCGYHFGGYVLSVSADVRIYRQNSDIEFYNENGANTSEIPMTGLGSYYGRFSGTGAYLDNLHRGGGYSVSLSLVPAGIYGFSASIYYRNFSVSRLLKGQNDAPLTELHIREPGFICTYKRKSGKVSAGFFLSGGVSFRNGDEMILDNGASNIYNVLGRINMYSAYAPFGRVGFVLQREYGEVRAGLMPTAWISSHSFSYRYPFREMKITSGDFTLPLKVDIPFRSFVAGIGLSAGYCAVFDSLFDIPEEYTEPEIMDMLKYTYGRMASSYWKGKCGISFQYRIDRTFAVFAEMVYGISIWRKDYGVCHNALLTAGIRF